MLVFWRAPLKIFDGEVASVGVTVNSLLVNAVCTPPIRQASIKVDSGATSPTKLVQKIRPEKVFGDPPSI